VEKVTIGAGIRFGNGFSVCHAGDTDVFTDMKVVGDILKPPVALLSIGDQCTMGAEDGVFACRLISPKYVIPIHFGTFPVLTGPLEPSRS
jgi:L-ascorbate metabolism protein UlaG (beta-lactamase superfamily)